MDKVALWAVVDQAGADADDASDAEQVMAHTVKLLACLPPTEIAAASQTVHDLMADSYRVDLWGAAHVIRLGGCSDDGFDFFRGWLIAQGRTVFERAVVDPDTLAELPFVRAAAAKGEGYIECPLMV
jgi:hypothetical protein